MKKIKVLVVTTSYPVIAGSGVFVKNLVNAFDENFEITVLTPSHQLLNESSFCENIKIVRYAPKKFETIAHSPGGIPQAIKEGWIKRFWLMSLLINLLLQIVLNGKKYDVIYANWAICGFLCGITKFFHRKKIVTSLRGSDVNRSDFSLIDNMLLQTALMLNDALVCVSLTAKYKLQKKYENKCSKFIFIPNGVANEFFEIGKKIYLNNVNASLIFCTVSSLVKTKSINTIIEAVSCLKADFFLYVIGEGSEEENLKKLAMSYDVEDKVKFMGYQSHNEIISTFKITDVFLFASVSEGRANVLYEALAAGLPIVASDIDANKELIDHENTGLLFKVGDPHDLVKKINRLIEDPELSKKLSKNAHQYIIDNNLTWQSTAKQYQDIFQRLVMV